MSLFAIVEGSEGETLCPSGLVVLDTRDNFDAARTEAQRLSAFNTKHYRVIQLVELIEVCYPALRVLKGEGTNPMSDAEMTERRAGIREYLAEQLKKGQTK